MDYVKAFVVGGIICALVQILMEKTKMLPGRIMVLLVCSGAVLSFLGIYESFQEFAGAGASVPLLGFGNVLMKGVKEAVDSDGLLGLFMGGFKPNPHQLYCTVKLNIWQYIFNILQVVFKNIQISCT